MAMWSEMKLALIADPCMVPLLNDDDRIESFTPSHALPNIGKRYTALPEVPIINIHLPVLYLNVNCQLCKSHLRHFRKRWSHDSMNTCTSQLSQLYNAWRHPTCITKLQPGDLVDL